MTLIDRYIHEVGRRLPRKNRADVLAELRSSLIDALEDRKDGMEASEEEVAALLKEFGSPREVAASYHPEGQYLIGPELYPLFELVAGIVLAAVLGAQVLAWAVAVFIGQRAVEPFEAIGSLLSSVPVALGMVVIVFAILQRLDVRAELDEKPWEPTSLPQVDEEQTVNRGERIFGIVGGVLILVVLAFFADRIGIWFTPGGQFIPNPVIGQYIGWIVLSLLASISLDIYLLWQGRWTAATRLARLAVSLFSIAVLFLLVQGHTAWLAERGAVGWLPAFQRLAEDSSPEAWQILGVGAFRMAFGVALIVTVIDTLVTAYRMIRSAWGPRFTPLSLPSSRT